MIKFKELKEGFTTMGIIIMLLLIVLICILSSCSKDQDCRFYNKGQLYLEHRTGECYYLKQGVKQYLEKEQCANYCE